MNWVRRALAVIFIVITTSLFFTGVYPQILPVGNSSAYTENQCLITNTNIDSGPICTTSGTLQTCTIGTRLTINVQYTPAQSNYKAYASAYYPQDGSYTQEGKSALAPYFPTGSTVQCWISTTNKFDAVVVTGIYLQSFWVYVALSAAFFLFFIIILLDILRAISITKFAWHVYQGLVYIKLIRNPQHTDYERFKCTLKRPAIVSVILALASLGAFLYILTARILPPIQQYNTNGYPMIPGTIQSISQQSGNACSTSTDGQSTCVQGLRYAFYLSFPRGQGAESFAYAYYPADGTYTTDPFPEYLSTFTVNQTLQYTYVGGQNLDQVVLLFYQYDPAFPQWIYGCAGALAGFILFVSDILGLCECFHPRSHPDGFLRRFLNKRRESKTEDEEEEQSRDMTIDEERTKADPAKDLPTPFRNSVIEFARTLAVDRQMINGIKEAPHAEEQGYSLPNTPLKSAGAVIVADQFHKGDEQNYDLHPTSARRRV